MNGEHTYAKLRKESLRGGLFTASAAVNTARSETGNRDDPTLFMLASQKEQEFEIGLDLPGWGFSPLPGPRGIEKRHDHL